MTAEAKKTRWWTIAVFAIALITRLLWISVPINTDEGLWIRRGPAFLQAVLQGRPADTYRSSHPGVTNMWLIGCAVASRYLLRDLMPAGDVARQSTSLPGYLEVASSLPIVPLGLFVQARILAALVTATCVAGFYALSRRLFGAAVAAIAALILLFEPFYLAYQRFLTTDANQTNFTWLALLAFLLYLHAARDGKPGALRWSLLSGSCFGLALLSKVPAVLSLPAFGLAVVWWTWTSKTSATRLRLLGGVLLWVLVTIVVTILLWPALRADPLHTVAHMFEGVSGEVAGHPQFYLGSTVADPGSGYYAVVLVYRLSPLLLLGSILGLISLVSPTLRRHLREPDSLTIIVLDLIVVLIAVSSVASKLDRYIMPLIPGLGLLAASGIWAAVSRIDEIRATDKSGRPALLWPSERRPGVLLILVAATQLAIFLPHVPYYVTYFNPLGGGPAQAQKLLMVGNGELLDQAAAWLHRQAPQGDATVATWYDDSFGPYYDGPTIAFGWTSEDEPDIWQVANFVVIYINNAQRNLPERIVEYFDSQRPAYEAMAHGLSYARVYPGPSVRDVDLARMQTGVNLDFQGNARLVGYDLETPVVPAGQTAVLALYWQALEPFPDPGSTVRVGIEDADGNLWGESDSMPVGGMLPVDQWQAGQIVRDVHQVTIPPGTPPGEYNLKISFWSPALHRALDIHEGDTLAGRDVTLTKLKVSDSPGRPGDATRLAAS